MTLPAASVVAMQRASLSYFFCRPGPVVRRMLTVNTGSSTSISRLAVVPSVTSTADLIFIPKDGAKCTGRDGRSSRISAVDETINGVFQRLLVLPTNNAIVEENKIKGWNQMQMQTIDVCKLSSSLEQCHLNDDHDHNENDDENNKILKIEVLNRNARKPKKANHGARPCSRASRRMKKDKIGKRRRG